MTKIHTIQVLLPIGQADTTLWSLPSDLYLTRLCHAAGLAINFTNSPEMRNQLIVRRDYAIEPVLLKLLASRENCILWDEGRNCPVALHFDSSTYRSEPVLQAMEEGRWSELVAFEKKTPLEIAGEYNSVLRKKQTPYLQHFNSRNIRHVEWHMFKASYKGATDFVTKYVWPLPAFWVTRYCAKAKLSPNQVTFVSFLLVLAAMALFNIGWFGWGLGAAWLMTFLDTVDGKLARVTLQSSKWGNIFDHGIDLIHPPFWYLAWYQGIGGAGAGIFCEAALWTILLGYILGRLQEGIFIALFKIEIHTWKRLDYVFRMITARRNPNLFLLMVCSMMGAPKEGFLVVAVWTVFSFMFHNYRIGAALVQNYRGKPPKSWLQHA